mmetsp:Transcript_30969/g.68620  ORF Transcript_30969/g.68620 Transcript_30969/m.68620 type:complete len:208 (-) Transcript_30969:295-918(-)
MRGHQGIEGGGAGPGAQGVNQVESRDGDLEHVRHLVQQVPPGRPGVQAVGHHAGQVLVQERHHNDEAHHLAHHVDLAGRGFDHLGQGQAVVLLRQLHTKGGVCSEPDQVECELRHEEALGVAPPLEVDQGLHSWQAEHPHIHVPLAVLADQVTEQPLLIRVSGSRDAQEVHVQAHVILPALRREPHVGLRLLQLWLPHLVPCQAGRP